MMVIISNNFSIYSYICYTTLSGRPGGYPDDDLIKFKKNKKKRCLLCDAEYIKFEEDHENAMK